MATVGRANAVYVRHFGPFFFTSPPCLRSRSSAELKGVRAVVPPNSSRTFTVGVLTAWPQSGRRRVSARPRRATAKEDAILYIGRE